MAVIRRINSTFWTDSKVADDFSADDRYLYIYLLTSPHNNICGCYEISIKQMAKQTGMSERRCESALRRLEEDHGVVVYDHDSKEVLIPKWGRHNWSTSDKLVKGVEDTAKYIKTPDFRDYVLGQLEKGIDTVSIPYRYSVKHSIDNNTISKSISSSISKSINKGIGESEGKGEVETDFDKFWAAYPRKVNKDGARASFLKVDTSLDTLLKAIAKQRRSRQWQEADGRYIPYPATWLNQRRWEDEVTIEPADDRAEPTPIYDLSKLVEYPPGSGLYRPPEEVPTDAG